MDEDGRASAAGAGEVRICGSRLLLRAFRPGEIEAEWQAMVDADPMTIAELPDETSLKARLQRSGHLANGWLDLAIDLDGVPIERIQTFVPTGRPLPPGTFEVGSASGRAPAAGVTGARRLRCSPTGCSSTQRRRPSKLRPVPPTLRCGRSSSEPAGRSPTR